MLRLKEKRASKTSFSSPFTRAARHLPEFAAVTTCLESYLKPVPLAQGIDFTFCSAKQAEWIGGQLR